MHPDGPWGGAGTRGPTVQGDGAAEPPHPPLPLGPLSSLIAHGSHCWLQAGRPEELAGPSRAPPCGQACRNPRRKARPHLLRPAFLLTLRRQPSASVPSAPVACQPGACPVLLGWAGGSLSWWVSLHKFLLLWVISVTLCRPAGGSAGSLLSPTFPGVDGDQVVDGAWWLLAEPRQVSTPGATSSLHCHLWRSRVHPVTSQTLECVHRLLPATEQATSWCSVSSVLLSPGTAGRGVLLQAGLSCPVCSRR